MVINGCDFWPDGNWAQCCDVHDMQFSTPGGLTEFITANTDLAWCVIQYSGWLNGSLMFIGVMVGGFFLWPWKRLGGKSIFHIITGKKYNGN
jgi:hypothetical protein